VGMYARLVKKPTNGIVTGSFLIRRHHSIDASQPKSTLKSSPEISVSPTTLTVKKGVMFPKRKGYINLEPPPPSAFEIFDYKPETYFR